MCVSVFSSHSFWTSSSLGIPAGVTQEEGHTGFFIHLLSAVCALIFLARRIQPIISLVDREVEFCVIVLHSLGILPLFLFLNEKNPVCRDRTHVPTCRKVTMLPLSYWGDRQRTWRIVLVFPETKQDHTGIRPLCCLPLWRRWRQNVSNQRFQFCDPLDIEYVRGKSGCWKNTLLCLELLWMMQLTHDGCDALLTSIVPVGNIPIGRAECSGATVPVI